MLVLLSTKEKEAAQKQFSEQLKKAWTEDKKRTITWRPSNEILDIVHDGNFWFVSVAPNQNQQLSRYWNSFGFYKKDGNLNITVEINIATEDDTKRVGGFFAKDDKTGELFLMHSGKVGGGAKGVGKNSFLAWCAEEPITIQGVDGNQRDGILVAPVGTAETADAVRRFVQKVADFKKDASNYVSSGEYQQTIKDNEQYDREHAGRKKGKRTAIIDYVSRHGDVVHALREYRVQKKSLGEVVPNTNLIDLYVARNKVLTEIYEVKTDVSRQSLYTAIGQLFVHTGSHLNVKQFVVLPDGEIISPDVESALKHHRIEIVRFVLRPLSVTIKPYL
jgi:ribosomal protein L19E